MVGCTSNRVSGRSRAKPTVVSYQQCFRDLRQCYPGLFQKRGVAETMPHTRNPVPFHCCGRNFPEKSLERNRYAAVVSTPLSSRASLPITQLVLIRPRGEAARMVAHAILQILFTWSDKHLHSFHIHGKEYGSSGPDLRCLSHPGR